MADLGADLACVSDLPDTMSMVSGRRALGEAIARRLQTPRGRLINYPNYGFDLTGELNDDLSPADFARIQSGVEQECIKDERVQSATCTLTFTAGTLTAVIVLVDGAGPFTLVLAATALDVTLLAVS